jgi:hypothetical protein
MPALHKMFAADAPRIAAARVHLLSNDFTCRFENKTANRSIIVDRHAANYASFPEVTFTFRDDVALKSHL